MSPQEQQQIINNATAAALKSAERRMEWLPSDWLSVTADVLGIASFWLVVILTRTTASQQQAYWRKNSLTSVRDQLDTDTAILSRMIGRTLPEDDDIRKARGAIKSLLGDLRANLPAKHRSLALMLSLTMWRYKQFKNQELLSDLVSDLHGLSQTLTGLIKEDEWSA